MTGRAVGDKCHLPRRAMSRGSNRITEPGRFHSQVLGGIGSGPVHPSWGEGLDVRDHRLDLVLGEASKRRHGAVGDAASEGSAKVFVRRKESGRGASELEDAGGEVSRTRTHPDRHLPASIAPPPVAHGAVALEHVSAAEMEVGPCNRCRAGGLRPPRMAGHAVQRDEHRADRHAHQEGGDDREPTGSRRVSHGRVPRRLGLKRPGHAPWLGRLATGFGRCRTLDGRPGSIRAPGVTSRSGSRCRGS